MISLSKSREVYWKLALLGGLWIAGCGGPRLYKVRPDVARATLANVLDQWKSGATPESLQQANPKVVVQDFDWTRGAELVDYEVLGDGEAKDANLMIKVRLTLRDASEKESTRTVTYLVGTDPVLTLFRAIQ